MVGVTVGLEERKHLKIKFWFGFMKTKKKKKEMSFLISVKNINRTTGLFKKRDYESRFHLKPRSH